MITSLNAKMIRRHPHIFGDANAETIDDLKEIWSKAKMLKVNSQELNLKSICRAFLNLYEKTKDKLFDEAALKQWLEKGE